MKACFGVGGGGCAPALTARKLGITPRIRFGCWFSGRAPSFAGAVVWLALFVSDCLLAALDVPDCSGVELCCGLSVSANAAPANAEGRTGDNDKPRACAIQPVRTITIPTAPGSASSAFPGLVAEISGIQLKLPFFLWVLPFSQEYRDSRRCTKLPKLFCIPDFATGCSLCSPKKHRYLTAPVRFHVSF